MSVQPVTLQGRHVRLEPLSLAHHADLCEAGLDEELWRWIPGQVMTILRMRTCGSPECRAVFAVCANCDRGQRYCSPSCRETVRRGQRRAADRRYQQSERGRQFHRRRQCRYRERQAPAPVTDQGCQKINSPTTSASSGHPPLHNLRSVQPLDQSISSGSATEVISGTVARSGSSSKIYVFRRSPTGSGASQRQLREKLLDAARRIQQLLPQLPLRCAGTDFFHLQGDSPAPPGGVFPQGADLQRDGLLIVGGNAGVETSAQHFRRFPCLAKNPMRFCLLSCLFGGHFGVSPKHGRRL